MTETSGNISRADAAALFLEKHYDKAAQAYADLLQKQPDNIELLSNLVLSSYYAQNEDEAAFKRCLDLLDKSSSVSPDMLYAMVPSYAQDGNVDVAEGFLVNILKNQPERINAALMLAEVYANEDDDDSLNAVMKQIFPRFKHDERVLCINAVYAFLNGNNGQAQFLFDKALHINRAYTICQYGFYDFLVNKGHPKKIIRYAKEALKIVPDDKYISECLLEAYIETQQYKNAEEIFVALDKKNDEMSDSVLAFWAETLAGHKKYSEAFDTAYRVSPQYQKYDTIFFFLGKMLYLMKDNHQEESCLERAERWMTDFSDDESVIHTCAAVLGKTQTPTPSPAFAKKIFDNTADDFEDILLKNLKYRGPEFSEKMLKKALPEKKENRSIVDLGCGTGLMGRTLKPYMGKRGSLTGVDISGRMLAVAKAKGVYTKLIEDDILTFLTSKDEDFNLVSCVDVFTCFGDIQPVLKSVHKALCEDGLFLFSITLNSQVAEQYTLQSSGRYAHSLPYVTALLDTEEFDIVAQEQCSLRTEQGRPVLSALILARKQ